MNWFTCIAIAIVIEGIVEYLKLSFPKLGDTKYIIPITILLGVGVCVAYNADILAVVGLVSPVPYIGNVLSGILLARGSNYVYDLVGKFTDAQGAGEAKVERAEDELNVDTVTHEKG